jgi:NADP-dependent 3-hydroxy acid dehydrogenase YdfG
MQTLAGKIAWVTGAGSGIGEAAALALAAEGASLVLTGRREAPLEAVAAAITAKGGKARVVPADLTDATAVEAVAASIERIERRLDILVSNAGINVPGRSWDKLTSASIDTLVGGNLASAFYVARAVLPMMRRQGDGLLIHTASWAGRFVGPLAGPVYTAAKHGVVAMSHSINLEECAKGIRSTVLCPAEVATPIMSLRDPPELPETLARMLQPEDLGAVVMFVAKQPAHVCLNEIVLSPTHNRSYLAQMQGRRRQQEATRAGQS